MSRSAVRSSPLDDPPAPPRLEVGVGPPLVEHGLQVGQVAQGQLRDPEREAERRDPTGFGRDQGG